MSVNCGTYHTMAITKRSEAYGWGRNHIGQLGLGDRMNRNIPHKIPIENVKAVSCGGTYTIILTSDGYFGCGSNGKCQLGLGYEGVYNYSSLQKINLFRGISISCGQYHSVALTVDGVYGWGANSHGQLGLGNNGYYNYKSTPQKIDLWDSSPEGWIEELRKQSGDSRVASISCGQGHTMILTFEGELFGTGGNDWGQLGVGHTSNLFKFQKIQLDETILSVCCGGSHTVVTTKYGEYYGCGSNYNGELGLGDRIDRHALTRIEFKKTFNL